MAAIMRYRAAENRDFAAVQALMHDLNPESGAFETDLAHWETLLLHPGTTVWLAEDKVPVACITLHVLPNMTYRGAPYGLIENVVTRADLRARGIGSGLMAHVLDRALAAGCYKVMLLTEVKRAASGFYQACGFSDQQKFGMTIYRDRSGAPRWRNGDEE